ncbi:MAG TPA: ABC transporter permease [Acidimicrobiia bacterium]
MSTTPFDAFDGDLPMGTRTPFILGAKLRNYGPALVLFVGGILLWEGAVRLFNIEAFVLPAPSVILQSLRSQWPEISAAAGNTMFEAFGGLVAGIALGVFMALNVVRFSAVRDGFLPFAIATNAIPIIALAPILNNMFPITSPVSKMAAVAIVIFFPVIINTSRGLTEVDPDELELMRSLASTPREVFTRVRIPHALPYFFSAVKIATTLSIIVAIVSEYFGGPQDTLGQYIIRKANLFVFPDAWAAIMVASLVGIALYGLILLIERVSMPWHVAYRSTDAN